MKNTYSAILLLSALTNLSAQHALWQRDIKTDSQDFLSGLATTVDRQSLVSGSSIQKAKPQVPSAQQAKDAGYDYHIVKLDQQGNSLWEKYFGGPLHDFLSATAATREGGFLLAGTSDSPQGGDKKEPSHGGTDIWVVRTDQDGNELWQQTLGYSTDEEARSATQAADGGFFIAGSAQNPKGGFGSKDAWIVRLDKDGRETSELYLGGTGVDEVEQLLPTEDGGAIAVLYSRSPAMPQVVSRTEAKNPAAPEKDAQGRPSKSIPATFQPKTSEAFGQGDYWVVKLDKDGRVQWQKTYGGKDEDHVRSVAATISGYVVTGSSSSATSGNKKTDKKNGSDLWVVALDRDGAERWQKSFSFGNQDLLMSLDAVTTKDGSVKGYLLGGYTQAEENMQKGDETFWMLYLDDKGEEVWRQNVEGNSRKKEERLVSAKLNHDGTYVLAGTSATELGKEGWKIVKLGDQKVKDLLYKGDFAVYPNPAEDYCYVEIAVPFQEADITLYDMAGKLVQSFKTRNAVNKINTQSLPQGVYLVTANTEEKKFNAKIVKK